MIQSLVRHIHYRVERFLALDNWGEILLLALSLAGLAVANSSLAPSYFHALHAPLGVGPATLSVEQWVNDLLMALFFLLVGLEIKREMVGGDLSSPSQIALPGIAALGGVLFPVLIYIALNWGHTDALAGWATPAATDIAFALAALSAFGRGLPRSAFLFLSSLAIFDDLAAILIIALFYSGGLSWPDLGLAALALAVLIGMNRLGVRRLAPYLVVGLALWVAVLRSGVHATMAGVLLALTIPLGSEEDEAAGRSPLHRLESALHPLVYFGVLPLFGFANAGVSFQGLDWSSLLDPVPLGIALGLFLGKQLGVFAFTLGAVRLGLAQLPAQVGWGTLYGIAMLCGIGFTMSLFIAGLAFPDAGLAGEAKLGVFSGSLISALGGGLWLAVTRGRK
ncbi:Na+/H+ antiporter NhaA [Nitrospirillum amazonense]|uniref:Na(+)/H(+) antiporter NhaA n=1 Tax=Nitrospirillum amazonense TaxID=28077 RepID=A0A560JI52_9PROT|nr:Na+/H+ antiporter NhaA [Nitrospirillum amazonense]MDG3439835.1 Na+/H+ antiporter NhaA [Nitrospirillum amazonense]TWB70881.1 sodium/proton antiporter (NhaA family) [Nitrospirillum amazonense]